MTERARPTADEFYFADDERTIRRILGPIGDPFMDYVKGRRLEHDVLEKALDDAQANGTLPEGISPENILGRAIGFRLGEVFARNSRLYDSNSWASLERKGI